MTNEPQSDRGSEDDPKKGPGTWDSFWAQESAPQLVLAARAVVPEAPRESGNPEIVEMLREHHLLLESLVADACGADAGAWGLKIAYRGDTVVLCVEDRKDSEGDEGDRLLALIVVAWRMVEACRDDWLRTCIGLSDERAVDVARYRPNLPKDWPVSVDLEGRGVERALSLVQDFGEADQLLLSGDLVNRVIPETVERAIPSADMRNVSLAPTKDRAKVLPNELRRIPVAQLSWDLAGPGTLTNRRRLGRELKALQPRVTDLIEYYAQMHGSVTVVYADEGAEATIKTLDSEMIGRADERLEKLLEVWDQSEEAQEQDLKPLVERVKEDHEEFRKMFKALQAAISKDHSGRRADARLRLQDAWLQCRTSPSRLKDAVESLIDEVYS